MQKKLASGKAMSEKEEDRIIEKYGEIAKIVLSKELIEYRKDCMWALKEYGKQEYTFALIKKELFRHIWAMKENLNGEQGY